MAGTQKTFSNPVTRLLPYTFLCTIGPSVTAATALFIVVSDYLSSGNVADKIANIDVPL